jgi:molybdate transport system substrate-binding protein
MTVLLAMVLGLTACTASGNGGSSSKRTDVTVLAAASLTEAFTALGRDFEAAHPDQHVVFSFAGSSTLAQQIISGAPADVFAAASRSTMDQVTKAALADAEPAVIARNQLVIAVRKGNPKGIGKLADLTRPGVTVALCAAQVPCGAAARTVLDKAKLSLTPVTLEPDVRAALAKVRLGEVDAALVYRTDIPSAAGDVDGVEFTESATAITDYPIVVVKGAPNAAGARDFVDFVRSAAGKTVLTTYGFQSP